IDSAHYEQGTTNYVDPSTARSQSRVCLRLLLGYAEFRSAARRLDAFAGGLRGPQHCVGRSLDDDHDRDAAAAHYHDHEARGHHHDQYAAADHHHDVHHHVHHAAASHDHDHVHHAATNHDHHHVHYAATNHDHDHHHHQVDHHDYPGLRERGNRSSLCPTQ